MDFFFIFKFFNSVILRTFLRLFPKVESVKYGKILYNWNSYTVERVGYHGFNKNVISDKSLIYVWVIWAQERKIIFSGNCWILAVYGFIKY